MFICYILKDVIMFILLCRCSLSSSVFRHFFLTAMLYVYGRFLNKHLVKTIHSDHLIPHLFKYGLIKYHMLICYSLYIAGNNIFLHIFLS